MTAPRYKHITTYYHEEMALPISEADTYLCPVCGLDWGGNPSYGENGSASDDICPTCRVHYGYDDCPNKWRPTELLAKRRIRLRIEWLDRVAWAPKALEQLRDQLGVTEEEARRDAQEMHET